MDLSLVPMDDIVDEMKKRFDTLVIITRKQIDKEADDIRYNFQDKVGCIGLMKIASANIEKGYEENETGTFD